MKQGFVKVAAVTPNMRVADVEYNVGSKGHCVSRVMYYRIHVWRPVLTGNSFA